MRVFVILFHLVHYLFFLAMEKWKGTVICQSVRTCHSDVNNATLPRGKSIGVGKKSYFSSLIREHKMTKELYTTKMTFGCQKK